MPGPKTHIGSPSCGTLDWQEEVRSGPQRHSSDVVDRWQTVLRHTLDL